MLKVLSLRSLTTHDNTNHQQTEMGQTYLGFRYFEVTKKILYIIHNAPTGVCAFPPHVPLPRALAPSTRGRKRRIPQGAFVSCWRTKHKSTGVVFSLLHAKMSIEITKIYSTICTYTIYHYFLYSRKHFSFLPRVL